MSVRKTARNLIFELGVLLLTTLMGVPSTFALAESPYQPRRPLLTHGTVLPWNKADYQKFVTDHEQALANHGYQKWTWLRSDCQNCAIQIVPKMGQLETGRVYEFLRALQDEKSNLLALYRSDPQEYNLLAQMAIGILGRESKFFESSRYGFKETSQWAIDLMKVVQIFISGADRDPSPNSRGPTQIKIVPEIISNAYHFNEDELHVPKYAAVATMGYLIEALKEMKRRVTLNDLGFITPGNYVDFLPYIYFGSRAQLLNGQSCRRERRTGQTNADYNFDLEKAERNGTLPEDCATPEANVYIGDMKRYMDWVEFYEGPEGSLGATGPVLP